MHFGLNCGMIAAAIQAAYVAEADIKHAAGMVESG